MSILQVPHAPFYIKLTSRLPTYTKLLIKYVHNENDNSLTSITLMYTQARLC